MKVLLVVESISKMEALHRAMPEGWTVVAPFMTVPRLGFDIVVVPDAIVTGAYRSPEASRRILDWYLTCVITSINHGGKILRV